VDSPAPNRAIFDKGIADLNEAVRLAPRDPSTLIQLAQVYELKGDPASTLSSLTMAIQVDPKDATGYSYRGGFHARRGQVGEAITDLDEALRLEPQIPKHSCSERLRIQFAVNSTKLSTIWTMRLAHRRKDQDLLCHARRPVC